MHEKRVLQHEWHEKHRNEKESSRLFLSLFKKEVCTTQKESFKRFDAWKDSDKMRTKNLASVVNDKTRNYLNY